MALLNQRNRDTDYSILSAGPGKAPNNRQPRNYDIMKGPDAGQDPMQDPLLKLQIALKNAQGGPAKSKIALDAISKVKSLPNADKLTRAIVVTTLGATKGDERAQFMADFIKSSPSKGPEMLEGIKPPELISLKGADLSKMDPKDVAILPLRKMEIAGATFPANVVLKGNQDGLNLANVTAPGLDVRGTTGTIKAAGADVRGGAINSSANKEEAIKNAAKLGLAGAKTDFKLADPKGNPLSWEQASSANGIEGVKKAMMNGLKINKNPLGVHIDPPGAHGPGHNAYMA